MFMAYPSNSSCNHLRSSHQLKNTVTSKGPAVFSEAAARSAPLPAMGLLELCEEVFGTTDLYRVLGVRREASDGEVRRGYHKVSLQVHPDRVGEGDKQDATRRFQILGKVYSVLSDKDQRAVYDEQGTVDEDSDVLSQDRDWETYWRLLFKKISLEDIQAFEKTYKGSEEELADVKQAYLDFKGDMDQIMESVLCVQYTEEPRIRNIIQQAIDAGEVPSYNAFVKESKQKMNARKRRAQEEAKEAEMSRKELGLDEGVDSLKAVIQHAEVLRSRTELESLHYSAGSLTTRKLLKLYYSYISYLHLGKLGRGFHGTLFFVTTCESVLISK
ncbi:dnaJ homolog subfamily C member 9 isoform X1 [Phacochoerus africanus]|uniref:dnaJ homolog subfamily C member 9 isoform X1 n=1 Tax=Phacochoerus africanus TaxID=41426 RepID=UPI001FD9C0BC|nr:dnaJ homolog subfamily C member 9 isoform X1 [Phacochoerus africanus]